MMDTHEIRLICCLPLMLKDVQEGLAVVARPAAYRRTATQLMLTMFEYDQDKHPPLC
jgi:hypothetical protein